MLTGTWTSITNGAASRENLRRLIIGVLWIALLLPASAQRITKVGEFTAAQDDVQFLPGAMVIVHNDIRDGKTKLYSYRSGKFTRVSSGVPPAIRNWKSFDWQSVDQFNQLDMHYWLESSMSGFLPPYSKVKAYATIPTFQAGKTIQVLCYAAVPETIPEGERATAGGGSRDLHLLIMSRKPGQTYTTTIYTKVADVLVANDVVFGTMLVEPQPAGTFVVVYFLSGGSSDYESIGIFLLQPNRPHHLKKSR